MSWVLIQRFAPAARGSGIPQVMAGIELSTPSQHQRTGYLLSLRVAIVQVLSSVALLLGGGVIRREGPTIQISAAIFRAINRLQPAGMALSYSGGAGGVFATSLSAGVLLGDGLCRLGAVPLEDRNLLILVSMVSFLTGVVRLPFTAAILVLEMTDRHSAIFQLLLSGPVAQAVASLVGPHSLCEHLKVSCMRETLDQPAPKPATRPERVKPVDRSEEG